MCKQWCWGKVLFVLIGLNLFSGKEIALAKESVLGMTTPDVPEIVILKDTHQSKMFFNYFDFPSQQPQMNQEVTPLPLGRQASGALYNYMITGASTYLCRSPVSMFALTDYKSIADYGRCRLFSKSVLWGWEGSVEAGEQSSPWWKRNYNGVFSGRLNKTSDGFQILTINHGEMVNGSGENCIRAADIGYGMLPCDTKDPWGTYNAFVTMSTMDFTSENLENPKLTEYGPIVWPAYGYVVYSESKGRWIKSTLGGVRHPMSLVVGGYLYVFYSDMSRGSSSAGMGPGIKVARAPIINGKVDPLGFYNYFNGSWDEKSLPEGYTLDKFEEIIKTKRGGRSSSISADFGVSDQMTSFSVARIRDTDYYLGVFFHAGGEGVGLTLSKDLVNWSKSYIIPNTTREHWLNGDVQRAPFLYARLANKNGDTVEVIEADEFYVTGSQIAMSYTGHERRVTNQIKLKIVLPPSNTMTMDLNNDGDVDIFDYNLLVDGYGSEYDVYDYNQFVAEFGQVSMTRIF